MATMFMLSTIILTLIMVLQSAKAGNLAPTKQCKEIICKRYEFCSIHESICRPCEAICTKTNDYYDEETCTQYCEDFMYDKMNPCMRKEELPEHLNDIYPLLVTILLLLITIILYIGAKESRQLYRIHKKKQEQKQDEKRFQQKLSAVQYTITNNHNNSSRDESSVRWIPNMHDRSRLPSLSEPMRHSLPSLRTLTTQADSTGSTNRLGTTRTMATTLPLSTEEPCEDTTLDYASYVNQGLAQSPSKPALTSNTSRF